MNQFIYYTSSTTPNSLYKHVVSLLYNKGEHQNEIFFIRKIPNCSQQLVPNSTQHLVPIS